MNYLHNVLQYFNLASIPPVLKEIVHPIPEIIDDCRISFSASKVLELNGRKIQVKDFSFETLIDNCQDEFERLAVENCKPLIERHLNEIDHFKSLFLHNAREGIVQFAKQDYDINKNESFCVKIDHSNNV